MSVHSTMTGSAGGIHAPYQWTFTSSAARKNSLNPLTGVAYTSADVGKVCYQSNLGVLFILTGIAPVWKLVSPYNAIATVPESPGNVVVTLDGITTNSIILGCTQTGALTGSLYITPSSGSFTITAPNSGNVVIAYSVVEF